MARGRSVGDVNEISSQLVGPSFREAMHQKHSSKPFRSNPLNKSTRGFTGMDAKEVRFERTRERGSGSRTSSDSGRFPARGRVGGPGPGAPRLPSLACRAGRPHAGDKRDTRRSRPGGPVPRVARAVIVIVFWREHRGRGTSEKGLEVKRAGRALRRDHRPARHFSTAHSSVSSPHRGCKLRAQNLDLRQRELGGPSAQARKFLQEGGVIELRLLPLELRARVPDDLRVRVAKLAYALDASCTPCAIC